MSTKAAVALANAVEVLDYGAFTHKTDAEIADLVLARLQGEGWMLVSTGDDAEMPDWAETLLNSLFTGARLDFSGTEAPGWLQVRLDAEYGMPVPTGEPATRHSSPADLDNDI